MWQAHDSVQNHGGNEVAYDAQVAMINPDRETVNQISRKAKTARTKFLALRVTTVTDNEIKVEYPNIKTTTTKIKSNVKSTKTPTAKIKSNVTSTKTPTTKIKNNVKSIKTPTAKTIGNAKLKGPCNITPESDHSSLSLESSSSESEDGPPRKRRIKASMKIIDREIKNIRVELGDM
ncbi:hypothetical protein IMZ48_36760 [Candidatus Bathyarchaeota archaeon]|nr:hypothetical protein [Candidatus Bathyarchaeota archaeon]